MDVQRGTMRKHRRHSLPSLAQRHSDSSRACLCDMLLDNRLPRHWQQGRAGVDAVEFVFGLVVESHNSTVVSRNKLGEHIDIGGR